ncbi:hypothetical protein PR048_006004 [Dryococelus australis]|uniref:Uncharacterized protein n=1 Tax=Dryococelus australis TaxID=614101 RepID=A0ABQ9I9S8_9NEOP|nr:hypothetical protein PR048_006004 [Dryococelus australis]
MSGSELSQRLARILPAELLMGRRLRICLDRVHADIPAEMKQNKEDNSVPVAPRRFSPQDVVYAQKKTWDENQNEGQPLLLSYLAPFHTR